MVPQKSSVTVLVTWKDHPVLHGAAAWGLSSCVHSVAESLGPSLVHLVMSRHPKDHNRPPLKAEGLGHWACELAELKVRATGQGVQLLRGSKALVN